jgi:hypothetical protein
MTLSTYDIGDKVRLSAVFTTTAGAFIDPTLVTFKVRDPSGNVSTVTSASTVVTNPSTGTFKTDIVIDEQGVWRWRVYSTGNITTAGEDVLVARKRWVSS